jgi:hypothetical protein
MTPFFVVLAGFLLRFALPLLLMVGLVFILRRLDARWQKEALLKQKIAAEDTQKHALDLRDCEIVGVNHRFTVQASEPCWQVFRKSSGYLHEECLQCKVFRAAPILIPNN